MSTIDFKNIDEWLFNYFEGNLSEPEKDELIRFLNKNPSSKADYEAWKKSYIHEPIMIYPNTDSLLKPQAALRRKRIKWGIALFVVTGLMVFYKMNIHNGFKLPTTFPGERLFDTHTLRKGKSGTSFAKPEKTGTPAKTLLRQTIAGAQHSGGEISPLSERTGSEGAFILEPIIIHLQSGLSESMPPPDSSEIIIKEQPAARKIKKGSKHKIRLKDMNVIRIQNPGF